MDALEAIAKRRSVRNYTGEPIPKADIEEIVNAGRLAATGGNRQPWDFIVVTQKQLIKKLMIAADWIESSAAVIAVVMDPKSRWWIEDGSAAIENMLLAATAKGYGSCWLEGWTLPHEEEFKTLLQIPDDRRLLTLVPIGVPRRWPRGKAKKSLAEVIHWETF